MKKETHAAAISSMSFLIYYSILLYSTNNIAEYADVLVDTSYPFIPTRLRKEFY